MGKLFSIAGEKPRMSTETVTTVADDEIPTEALSELLVEGAADLSIGMDATQMAVERYEMLCGMYEHMQEQKLCSGSYMATMESYSPVVQAMGARMGVKSLPALEDFSNPHAAKVCHSIAMEGFKEWISKAWEKIKSFFRDFFKKISEFLKRVVKANLELESYEKYCEQLIAKLNANNAKFDGGDTKLSSTLPSLLANRGDTQIGSDFILNVGQRKVSNLLGITEDLLKVHAGAGMVTRLKEFHSEFTGFIQRNKSDTPEDAIKLEQSIDKMKETGHSLLASIFPCKVIGVSELPPKAQEAVRTHYDGREINSELFEVWSITEINDPYKELPSGVNLILTHVGRDNFYVAAAKEDPAQVANYVEPISNLNNLTKFYKDYKSTLGKLNLSSLSKTEVQVSDEIDKILRLLQKDFGGVVEAARGLTSGRDIHALVRIAGYLLSRGVIQQEIQLSTYALEEINELYRNDRIRITKLNEYLDLIPNMADTTNGTGNAIEAVTKLIERDDKAQSAISLIVDGLKKSHADELKQVTDEARKSLLVDFNKYLSNLFLRLQSVYKTIMTDFYGHLTTIRYQVIKYIYDSAKLYTY